MSSEIISKKTKNVIITGVSSGIGLGLAKAFLNEGCNVFGFSRTYNEDLKDEPNFNFIRGDISKKSDIEIMRDYLVSKKVNKIDILVNNAGLALGNESFEDGAIEDFITMINVNVLGSVLTTKILLPLLRNSSDCRIINIGSIASSYQYKTGHIYAASKAFLEHMTDCLRTELQSDNFSITLVKPGRVNTNFEAVKSKKQSRENRNISTNVLSLEVIDIVETIIWITKQPKNVSVSKIEILPSNTALSY